MQVVRRAVIIVRVCCASKLFSRVARERIQVVRRAVKITRDCCASNLFSRASVEVANANAVGAGFDFPLSVSRAFKPARFVRNSEAEGMRNPESWN